MGSRHHTQVLVPACDRVTSLAFHLFFSSPRSSLRGFRITLSDPDPLVPSANLSFISLEDTLSIRVSSLDVPFFAFLLLVPPSSVCLNSQGTH